MRNKSRLGLILFMVGGILLISGWLPGYQAAAEPIPLPDVSIGIKNADNPQKVAASLQILFLLTVLSLAPALLVMMTSFTRVVVVLSFMRNALGTQQTPPNQVLIGLALFLTFFIMAPTWNQVNKQALQPYLAGQIGQEQALKTAAEPVRNFMFKQTREKDLALFVNLAKVERPRNYDDIPAF